MGSFHSVPLEGGSMMMSGMVKVVSSEDALLIVLFVFMLFEFGLPVKMLIMVCSLCQLLR